MLGGHCARLEEHREGLHSALLQTFHGGKTESCQASPKSQTASAETTGVTPRYLPVISTDVVHDFGEAWQGAGFPLWKVCSGAECKPSLCSSRQGQWPPGMTLLWGLKLDLSQGMVSPTS